RRPRRSTALLTPVAGSKSLVAQYCGFRTRCQGKKSCPAGLGSNPEDALMAHAPRRRNVLHGLALALSAPLLPSPAHAAEPADMLLVLAHDVSRSVTEPKFRLQRDGTAAAITHPDVVRAITAGPHRRIAV